MKKSLLSLVVAFVTFSAGISVTAIFNFGKETVSNFDVKESNADDFPVIKIDPPRIEEGIQNKAKDENLFSRAYRLDDFKDLNEVKWILLQRDYGAHENSNKIISSSIVLTSSEKKWGKQMFVTLSAKVDNGQVKFRTEEIKGIEYRFEGNFFKNKTAGEDDEEFLRGTLQKFIKGKKVAEINGDFVYCEPHCLY